MAKKVDRRIQRTRKLLRDALITLSLERGYDAITIQDITDFANLGRATFYLHYKDKDDLLLSTLQETIDDLVEQIRPPAPVKDNLDANYAILTLVNHAAEHADLYRIMLYGSSAAGVERRLHEIATNIAFDILKEAAGEQPDIPVDLAAYFFARSALGIIHWWLDNDTPYTIDYIVNVISMLCVTPMNNALGIVPLQATKNRH